MNQITVLLILIFFSYIQVKAATQYQDLIVTNKFICALTDSFQLKLFDKASGKPVEKEIQNSSGILSIAVDKTDKLTIAGKDNFIKRYNDENNSWEVITKYEGNIYGILFNSKNLCYLVTDKGIEDAQTHKVYFSDKSLNHQIHYKKEWGRPYCYYMDKTDRIWLGFGYGEWGGNLFIFETTNNQFLDPILGSFRIELWPIKSFFEDSTAVYLSSGLQHMMTSGTIIRFDNLDASVLLESKSSWSAPKGKDKIQTIIDGEYVGPATFNKFNNSIYFYSQNGIFKGDTNNDLSKIENWEIIIKPKLHWKGGQRDAVGSPMNVLKLILLDKNKLVFLSQNDGIGYFDGEKIITLN